MQLTYNDEASLYDYYKLRQIQWRLRGKCALLIVLEWLDMVFLWNMAVMP